MARYVLISDTTLSHYYRNFPLLDFLPSAPSDQLPKRVYSFLKGKSNTDDCGRAKFAPYALRKVEAALRQRHDEKDVVIVNQDSIDKFVDDNTEFIGVSTMDPLGLGPLTMSLSVFFQTDSPAFVQVEFEKLMMRLNNVRKGKKAKLVVVGPGVRQPTVKPEEKDR